MKRDLIIKLAVVAPVMFLTWFVTSTIMGGLEARAQVGRAASKTREPKAASAKITGAPAPVVAADEQPRVNAPRSSMLLMDTLRVTVQGHQVSVAATAKMEAVKRNKIYMWKLEVYPGEGEEPSLVMPYVEQAFLIHPSGVMNPTFSESFQLPPGKHRVSVSLHKFPMGTTVDDLRVGNDKDAVGREQVIEVH